MFNILLSGAGGKMGHTIAKVIKAAENLEVIAGVDLNTERYDDFPIYKSAADFAGKADAIIDFSHPSALAGILGYAKETKTPIVVATTGLSEEQIASIKEASSVVPVFYSANMSLGVNLLLELAKKAASVLEGNFDIEIVERHHNQKIDAPSGTALMIANAVSEALQEKPHYVYDRHAVRQKRDAHEIGIHAVRGGNIVGDHELIFAGTDEVIEIHHHATSKEVFAVGSVRAAGYLIGKPAGLYNMQDLIRG